MSADAMQTPGPILATAPVLSDARLRLSLFGWWLEAGRLYELDGEAPAEEEEEEEERGPRKRGQKRRAQQGREVGGRSKAGRKRY